MEATLRSETGALKWALQLPHPLAWFCRAAWGRSKVLVLAFLNTVLVTKASLVANSLKSEPVFTAFFGVLLILVASLLRRWMTASNSETAQQPALEVNRASLRRMPDFRITEVAPSRMEISEHAASN
jgi:hypothetical protein